MPIDLSRKIVQKFADNYHIIQVCNDEAQGLPDPRVEVLHTAMPNNQLFGLVGAATKIVGIDSSIQHIAKALNKQATVVWIATHSSIFGYDSHKNVQAKLDDKPLPNSYLYDYDFQGSFVDCPFKDPSDVLDFDEVIQSI
jgi:ADP-heptose:LPS heptosyltransferase